MDVAVFDTGRRRWAAAALQSALGGLRHGLLTGLLTGLTIVVSVSIGFSSTASAQGRTDTKPAPAPASISAPEYRFKQSVAAPPTALSADALSAEDRAFLAGLPEIRVALQRAGGPPYERVGPDGEISGFQPEMLVTLARMLGLRIVPVVLPDWPSTLAAVREGRADMVLTLRPSAERLQYLAFTLGTSSVSVAVFGRSGQPLPPLAQARFALEREYYSNDVVRRRYPAATVVPVTGTEDALRQLAGGGADVYLGNLLEALDVVAQKKITGVEVKQFLPAEAGYYHFGIRQDWARLATILNKGISGWRSAGLSAATAPQQGGAMAPGLSLPAPLAVSAAEAQSLGERSVWRVGVLRGLELLNGIDANGQHSGLGADYAQQVARRLGVGLEPVIFEDRLTMIKALEAGRLDLLPLAVHSPEREGTLGFSKVYLELPRVLVGRNDAALYWDLDSLRGKTLALTAGSVMQRWMEQRHPQIKLRLTRTEGEAIDEVQYGMADAALAHKLEANLRVNADTRGRLRVLGELSGMPAQFAMATSPQLKHLVPAIDRALADIDASEREHLLRRWVAVDLHPPLPWRRWAPTIAVAVVALLLLAAATLVYLRRLSREVQRRRRADEQLDDIGRTIPGVAFRYVLAPRVEGAPPRILRTFFSSGAEALFGFVPPPRQSVLEFAAPRMRPNQLQDAVAAQARALATGEPFRRTVAYRHPDGSERWLHSEVFASTTRGGEQAFTGFIVDASAEHALQEQLAQEARHRHLMLASASHELRAPTHTITLALQDPALAELPPAAQRPIAIARESARTIGALLDDVLDAARLDAGRLELRPQDFDLLTLLQQLAEAQRTAAADKRLAFVLEIGTDVPRTAHGDPLRIKQVLTNLLSNAVKYTDRGEVALRVSRAVSESGAALCFEVRDTGRGIAAGQQQRLFEPFVNVVNVVNAAVGSPVAAAASSGLGLSICRRLVDLMQGRIELESQQLGEGTRVRVWLPLRQAQTAGADGAPAAAARAAAARPPAAEAAGAEGVLLLCDDDDVSRLLMSAALARLGHQVEEVPSAEAALARWRLGGVRTVVTDLAMPGLGGNRLVQEIRRAEAEGRAPDAGRIGIVLCSGSEAPVQAEGSRPMHDAFLSKPVDLRLLADTLERLGA